MEHIKPKHTREASMQSTNEEKSIKKLRGARFLRRDSVSSIAYSEELISDTMSATLQSTDRHYGIVDQEPDHFQLDS